LPSNKIKKVELRSFIGSGSFIAALETSDDISLFGNGLIELRSGTHTFFGDFGDPLLRVGLSALGMLNLVYPNPANPATTLSKSFNINLEFDSDGVFSPVEITNSLPSVDLEWLALVPNGGGSEGKFTVGYSAGVFNLAVSGYDLDLFNQGYTDLGMSASSNGVVSVTGGGLGAKTFQFGSGQGLMQLVAGSRLPFSWNVQTGSFSLTMPNNLELSFLGNPVSSGTLLDGFDLDGFTIDQTGAFEKSFSHNLTVNGASLGNFGMAFKRDSASDPIELLIDNESLSYTGGNGLLLSMRAASTGSFVIGISGSLSINVQNTAFGIFDELDGKADGVLKLLNLDLDIVNPTQPGLKFSGEVSFVGTKFILTLGRTGSNLTVVFTNLGSLPTPFVLPNL